MSRLLSLARIALAAALAPAAASAQSLEPVAVEAQPLLAQVERVAQALEVAGSPLPEEDIAALLWAREAGGDEASRRVQEVLAPHVLFAVHVNPESRVKVARGPARAELAQNGWRAFLVRVHNEAGVTAQLRASSPQAEPVYVRGTNSPEPAEPGISAAEGRARWMDLAMHDRPPLEPRLSGLELEYRVLLLHSRDAGKREATFAFDVGQGTQDLGFRAEASALFTCVPSVQVTLDLRDEGGGPTTASFAFFDSAGRVYPTPAKRLAPDFFFHWQVYRSSGETVQLSPGDYNVYWQRGPEYIDQNRTITVPEGVTEHEERFELERWIHPRAMGWWSGDHHVHAGGCAHYESPTAGVLPEDMWRHQLGEDLNVACVLSWGPCWYFQKQFFEGGVHDLSDGDYLMRYDVEVSGFPSQHCGHLCLLRLEEDDYPGTERIEDWPTWDLPILKWAKAQGGVVGFAHSGWGLAVQSEELPCYEVPAYDGIGANEYIVDVTHDAVDFLSTIDTPYVWELNIWYHTLNCGYRTRISGETDFPCIYGERVGLGRVYCKLEGELDFDRWVDALAAGRSYVSDGSSHLLEFSVDGVEVGTGKSEVHLDAPGKVRVRARVAARLSEQPDESIKSRPYTEKPYWHLERARIGDGRTVPVEVVVNGEPVAQLELVADGVLRELDLEVPIERSSWVALRILPSAHTNPIFVLTGGAPVRASRRSAQWCLDSVDRCWTSKRGRIAADERAAAKAAYDVARAAYRAILAESEVD